MLCERRVLRWYVSWTVARKATEEDYLQYLIEVVYNEISLDVALFFKYPLAWITWHLKLVWSSLVVDEQTQAKCVVVAGVPMLIQTTSFEDTRPKSTWISSLRKTWYKDLHQSRFLESHFWTTFFCVTWVLIVAGGFEVFFSTHFFAFKVDMLAY